MPFRLLPQVPPIRVPLQAALRPGGSRRAHIDLRVRGGIPSQRLELSIRITPDNQVTVKLIDRLRDREASLTLTPSATRCDLLRRAILESNILRLDATLARVPFDSVTGRLHITVADTTPPSAAEWAFLADAVQAGQALDVAPLELVRGVGPILALGKEALQVETVDPNLFGDGAGPVTVAAVVVDPAGADLSREHVALYNLGARPVPVGGFALQSRREVPYKIREGLRLAPHGVLRIWTGAGSDTDQNLYQGRDQSIWSRPDDRIALLDPRGEPIAKRSPRHLRRRRPA
jgi:hypothetical protein